MYVGSIFSIRSILTDHFFSVDTGPELYKGAAVCVQLAGYRHADEALAGAATIVDSIIGRTSQKEL